MTAKEHAEKASAILSQPFDPYVNQTREAEAHALVAIALALLDHTTTREEA